MRLDDIEETLPKKPSFLLILILFCAVILVFLAGTILFLHLDRNHMNFLHHRARPDARLMLPVAPTPSVTRTLQPA